MNNFKYWDWEHPDIADARTNGYPRRSWDDSPYEDEYDGLGDYGVDIDALFDEARLAQWDRR